MKNQELLTQLRLFYQEDPTDPFNAYALAMALVPTNGSEARQYLEALLKEHPDYLPAYYQLGKLYEAFNEGENALKVYRQGISLAATQQNGRTLEELKRAERMLQEELEDW